jgi:GLPGLI family protein
MKKILFILLISVSFCNLGIAQKNQTGKITYLTVMDFNNRSSEAPVPTNMNSTEASLYFDKSKSLFIIGANTRTKEVETKDESGNVNSKIVVGSQKGLNFYKNLKTNEFISTEPIFDKIFTIKDTMNGINWTINFEKTKKIGNFTCTEATTDYRGRKYIAWFTEQIPVSQGPWKLYGLPGLIIEAYDTTRQVNFLYKDAVLNQDFTNQIIAPPTNNAISFNEYKARFKKKVKDFERSMQQQNSTNRVEISGTIEPLN